MKWKLTGCAPLEAVVKTPAPNQCGNAILDPGEVCDPGEPEACNGQPTKCINCLTCSGTGATPTPAPGSTPTPINTGSADCPQGELPPLNREGFDGWRGIDGVQIADGQTHTYCYTLSQNTTRLVMSVGDRTGATQCFEHTAEYIPPAGSGMSSKRGGGVNSSYTFLNIGAPLPQGVWRIRITAAVNPDCADRYQVIVHF
ncbi:MAG TPA: hypothetical protein VFD92_19720 [Candidatus Binatia bacterium]|nr:hypothetical protein [Candidatus Binatia bacterium]